MGVEIMDWVTRVERVRRSRGTRWGFAALLALLVLADLVTPREHLLFEAEAWPGFSALYGLVSCVLIIWVSKLLGHAGLMKPEDYYD
jgi:hypothetical protein